MSEVAASGILPQIPKTIDEFRRLFHIPSKIVIINNLNSSLTLAPDGGSSGVAWPDNITPGGIVELELTLKNIIWLSVFNGYGIYTTTPKDPRVDSQEDSTEIVVSLAFVALRYIEKFFGYGGTSDSDKVQVTVEIHEMSIDWQSRCVFTVAPPPVK